MITGWARFMSARSNQVSDIADDIPCRPSSAQLAPLPLSAVLGITNTLPQLEPSEPIVIVCSSKANQYT